LATIIDTVAIRAAGGEMTPDEINARIGTRREPSDPETAGGVALLPLHGVIMPRASLFSDVSGGMSVESFRDSLRAAMADPDVNHIVIDVDSPGGRVEMVHELAAEIRAARADKRITAQVNTLAGSAAYWLAAQADEIVATPSGSVGSIGVFAAHEDLSKLREDVGVKTTLISQGRFKTEGNPFEPLSDDARDHIQELVDETYDRFVNDVAAGRGVRADEVVNGYGEGRLVTASMGHALGMVDDIAPLEATLARALTAEPTLAVAPGVWFTSSSFTSSSNDTNPPSAVSRWTDHTAVGAEVDAGPIASHSTPTTDTAWDAAAATRNCPSEAASLRAIHAWVDSSGDPDAKSSYKFPHHSRPGAAANMTACSSVIAVLNGGRGGANIPDGDRRGVYAHVARHLRDGDREPPELKGRTFVEEAHDALAAVDAVLARADSLAEYREGGRLTTAKRDTLVALHERLTDMIARTTPSPSGVAPLDELDEHDFDRFG